MGAIIDHIRALESYIKRSGARLVRATLPESVQGRVFSDHITLRADLDSEQQLLTLVHELAHWLAHRNAGRDAHCAACTIYEYEAEAVEALVMARLGLPHPGQCPAHLSAYLSDDNPTDDLLPASVARVLSVSGRICDALGLQAG